MDYEGRKQEIASSKAAFLPAWSDDGRRLAYLEKTGKNKAVLRIVDVTRPE
jgi:Tol biopolymer transport system component